ncbi:MAG: zinc ribbon domain-containing protein [Lentisphaerae bacterium]|nr:zinc ribbon domain-containing protein [Lentisphaerota bacterium]
MPTYEYKCESESCGYRFDFFQKMTDARLESCPKCGGRVRRLIGSGAGIIFKGSGFYCTDYKNKAPVSTPSGESSGTAADSKPVGNTSSANTTAGTPQK